MEKFPKIDESQVVLLRAERQTGIALDENFERAGSEEQKVFTIFASLEGALEYARRQFFQRKNIEFVIWDKNQEVLKYLEGE